MAFHPSRSALQKSARSVRHLTWYGSEFPGLPFAQRSPAVPPFSCDAQDQPRPPIPATFCPVPLFVDSPSSRRRHHWRQCIPPFLSADRDRYRATPERLRESLLGEAEIVLVLLFFCNI